MGGIRSLSATTYIFWPASVLSLATGVILAALAIRLATTSIQPGSNIRGFALAASVLEIFSQATSVATAVLYLRRTARRVQLVCSTAFSILAILATLLMIYTLAWIWTGSQHVAEQHPNIKITKSLTKAGFAMWAIATVSQVVLYAIVLWPQNHHVSHMPAEELAERPSPVHSVRRTISVHLGSLKSPPPAFSRSATEPVSSAFSINSTSPRSSFRYSVRQVIRPTTSKTMLLLRQSLNSRDSRSLHSGIDTPIDTTRQDDGFATWDTSAVEDNDNPFIQRSTRTRLDPIPGSRPVSPAKPLDGPFPDEIPPEDRPLPDSPLQSPIGSPSSETSSLRAMSPTLRRPRSNSNAQAHIHPLFRSESPNPPPLASPGTIITASPLAGQVVNPDHQVFAPRRLHSAQSNYQPESSSSLSPPRSRAGSFRSVRMQPPSPIEDLVGRGRTSSLVHTIEHED